MTGVVLPGSSDVDIREVPVPAVGPGQVLLRMRASTICGSDLRAVYHGHVGPEPYWGVIAGHEPCGEVVEVGAGTGGIRVGERVVVYHISGCGRCAECHAGYMISCTAEPPVKLAYGWQRDGGHADYLLADLATCVTLPDGLSFIDGACVACGFGTAYEALCRAGVSGRDTVLVTGVGPVGMATGMLAKAMGSQRVIGVDVDSGRLTFAESQGCIDEGVTAGADALEAILELTGGEGCEVSVDCSG